MVKAKDELTENHKDAENIVTGVMPENPGDRLCPIKSYNKYIMHLNPENEFLWQVPMHNINMETDIIWFGKGHVGKNPLSKFMSTSSANCKLSRIYTNHCIQVTGATVLTRMKFSASEIMSLTGHKSVKS